MICVAGRAVSRRGVGCDYKTGVELRCDKKIALDAEINAVLSGVVDHGMYVLMPCEGG